MLRQFLNEIGKHLNSLENLGDNISDHCVALFLIHLISSKVDKDSEKEWEIKFAKMCGNKFTTFYRFLS